MTIFVFAKDDRGLEVFLTEQAAISICEGIDVEEGNYLFWDRTGEPLEVVFTKPNDHGRFTILSGAYRLQPTSDGTRLASVLKDVSNLVANESFSSIDAIKDHLVSLSK